MCNLEEDGGFLMAKTLKKGRAAIYKGLGHPFEIKEYPVPEPEPGAILIKVRRANICGSDLHTWRGDYDLAAMGLPLPVILGHEMIGTVAKLGEGIGTDSAGQPLAEGDRVVYRYFFPCGRCWACLNGQDAACPMAPIGSTGPSEPPPHFLGAYAEYYYLRPNHTIFKVPDDVSDEVAASANCALSEVIYGFERVGLKFGESVVIQGAGGLGVYATAVAKEMGASRVIVIDGISQRLELAKAFGADDLIDLREFKTPDERVLRVRELTAGWGAHVVAELAGFSRVVPEGVAMLGNGGRYLEIGNITAGMTYEADPSDIVMGNKSIVGVFLYEPHTLKKALEFLSSTKDKYHFEEIYSRSYPLSEINKAFEDQENGLVTRAAIVP
jgi:D-arabinose 1-dehydrogenase-like Zn-dependent alcohol dehydrogenase